MGVNCFINTYDKWNAIGIENLDLVELSMCTG